MTKVSDATKSGKKAASLLDSPRPFRNHYAGMHIGACSTAQSAMVAAFKHLIYGEASKATIVGPDDKDIGRLHWTPFGISVWAPPSTFVRPVDVTDQPLRRVK